MKPYRVSIYSQTNGQIFNEVIMAGDAKIAVEKAISLVPPEHFEWKKGDASFSSSGWQISFFPENKAFFIATK